MKGANCVKYYCRNGQVVYVRQNAQDAGIIDVFYGGLWYQRPKSAIGRTLFPEHPAVIHNGSVIALEPLTPEKSVRFCVGGASADASVIPLPAQVELAQKLIGRRAGEIVHVEQPDGSLMHYMICSVSPY